MNRLGTLAIAIILLAAMIVTPQAASAQTSKGAAAAATADAARVRDLVAYAKAAFEDGQTQPPAAAEDAGRTRAWPAR